MNRSAAISRSDSGASRGSRRWRDVLQPLGVSVDSPLANKTLSAVRSPTVISFNDLHDGPAAFGGRGSVFSRRAAERGVDGGPAANVRAPASCRRGRVQPERSEELPR